MPDCHRPYGGAHRDERGDLAAAVVTVVLGAAGVIVAIVVMNRFGTLLSLAQAPELRASGA